MFYLGISWTATVLISGCSSGYTEINKFWSLRYHSSKFFINLVWSHSQWYLDLFFHVSVCKMQWMPSAAVHTTDNTSIISNTTPQKSRRVSPIRICTPLPAQVFEYINALRVSLIALQLECTIFYLSTDKGKLLLTLMRLHFLTDENCRHGSLADIWVACSLIKYIMTMLKNLRYHTNPQLSCYPWVQHWGEAGDVHNLGLKWVEPTEAEEAAMQALVCTFLTPELTLLHKVAIGEKEVSRLILFNICMCYYVCIG